ncbi:MAG: peptidoglycan bridge formation glycyltransferase FemA/FemB family protein [Candidatus Moranbacteria bacterium]|nr:peptidoglycan bridge formation glycyltransferase FemA/FemB family protein [Candidatus Moranbacteria bacterium]
MEKGSLGEQQLLQSFQWERFQNKVGNDTFRFGDKHILGLCIEQEIPLIGKYAYCPRGPRIQISSQEAFQKEEVQNLLKEAQGRGCFWLRIEPCNKEILQEIKERLPTEVILVPAPKNIQPQEILVMDISKQEEELLSSMKTKTRYNIRLAQKKGVQVLVTRKEKYQKIFFKLIQTTAKRAKIKTHSFEYYKKMFAVFDEKKLQLYVALRESKVLAINMIIIQKDCAIYLHGGSSNEQRNCMAPFLLHWQAIKDMKKLGCVWYDFGGVSHQSEEKNTQKKEREGWNGITRFKTSFCPKTESIKFPGTYDIILNSKRYFFYTLLRKLRRRGR